MDDIGTDRKFTDVSVSPYWKISGMPIVLMAMRRGTICQALEK